MFAQVFILTLCVVLSTIAAFLFARQKYDRVETLSREDAESLKASLLITQEKLSQANQVALNKDAELEKLRSDLMGSEKAVARAEAELRAAEKKLAEEDMRFREFVEASKKEIKIHADQTVKDSSSVLLENSKAQLKLILDPLKERIENFSKDVQDKGRKEVEQFTHLRGELEKLFSTSNQLSAEAHALTAALKGDSKVQGDYGEAVLNGILEGSGLREGIEFVTQNSGKDSEGNLKRPDVVVKLPGDRCAIIDSKMSLTAYSEMCAAVDPQAKETLLKSHVDSVKRHIHELAAKDYPALYGIKTPDFTFMFVPIEAAFLALRASALDVQELATRKKIVILTASTLHTALRLVDQLWQVERRGQAAEEIATQARALYEKFSNFIEDMDSMGRQLKSAQDSYDKAMKKLNSGKGNLIRQVERLKEMKVFTTSKQLPLESDESFS